MSLGGKVLKLNLDNKQEQERLNNAFEAAPAPFRHVKSRVEHQFKSMFQELFDNVDNAFFQKADNAETNGEQNIYFEAMREVRMQRQVIEDDFFAAQSLAYCYLCVNEKPNFSHEESEALDELSLLSKDELEEQVAADAMVAKANAAFDQDIKNYNACVDSLLKFQKIDHAIQNPLSPKVICKSFLEACKCLDVDIKSRLVFLKLFDRIFIENLHTIYRLANQVMLDSGVKAAHQRAHLPRAKNAVSQSSASRTNNQNMGIGDVEPVLHEQQFQQAIQESELFAGLQALMEDVSGRQANYYAPELGLAAPGRAPELPQQSLFKLLGMVQQYQLQQLQEVDVDINQRYAKENLNVHNAIGHLIAKNNPGKKLSLGKTEDDVIGLVAMLFQFILDDGNLATELKAHIARLQIPLIRVAMHDASFFAQGSHPARQLLNDIASAGMGWVPPANLERDPLYKKLNEIVMAVVKNEQPTSDFFEILLNDFDQFKAAEAKRLELVAQRTIDAEDGKDKQQVAKRSVENLLNEKMAGMKLPKLVIEFVENEFSQAMYLALVKHSEESDEWQALQIVLADLLWSLQPKNYEELAGLENRVPEIKKSIINHLTPYASNQGTINEFITQLEKIYESQLKPLKVKKVAEQQSSQGAEKTIGAEVFNKPKAKNESSVLLNNTDKNNRVNKDVQKPAVKSVTSGQNKHTKIVELKAGETLDQYLTANPLHLEGLVEEAVTAATSSDNILADESYEVDSFEIAEVESCDNILANITQSEENLELSDEYKFVDFSSIEGEGEYELDNTDEFDLDGALLDLQEVDTISLGVDADDQEDIIDVALCDEDFKKVDELTTSSWINLVQGDETVKCRLATVLKSSGKYVFVNRAGVKVAEYKRKPLAAALKKGQMVPVQEGQLFDRALQSLIGNLRSAGGAS